MLKPTLTVYGNTSPAINGSGKRKLDSWIGEFVSHTDNLESAPIFRKWAAISTIAAVLEQKVYVKTSSSLYPNLYTFLVGRAGIGKTRPIMSAMGFIHELPEMEKHIGATSMTGASLVDHMAEAKRTIIQLPDPAVEYNSLFVCADELSAFMHQHDKEINGILTTMYDRVPYSQGRRKNDLRIKIPRPLLNVLCGTTPANLIELVPEYAWSQGFTSRTILVYSDERPVIDVFNTPFRERPADMLHDLKIINSMIGQFGWTKEWADTMHRWKEAGHAIPGFKVPSHPRLNSYCERRFAHMIKLSMVASVDRGTSYELTKQDFNTAMGWLAEAELHMGSIFQSTASAGTDSQAMDEIAHYVKSFGAKGASEHQIVRFAKNHVPINSVRQVVGVMIMSKMIRKTDGETYVTD